MRCWVTVHVWFTLRAVSISEDSRCPWCHASELYRRYHDEEWGIACHDEQKLFELLNLEGAQAGLSWITILNKREHYRRVFRRFDPGLLVRFTTEHVNTLVIDPGIVRHRGKIEGVITNAGCLLNMYESGETLHDLAWSFVDGQPVDNHFRDMSQVPASTATSRALCRELKRRGFKFVGETICYAFMQAAGLVNDHLTSCPSHARIVASR